MRVPSRAVNALQLADEWEVEHFAVGVRSRAGDVDEVRGSVERRFPWASITKLVTALAVLVAFEEGTVDLDEPAGPPGSTVRHLLAHASGLGPDDPIRPMATPGARRIYSNAGFEVLGTHLRARSGMSFDEYARAGVLEPIGMAGARTAGSPATGASGTLADLLALGAELLAPAIIDPSTLAAATTVCYPGLVGVLPGFGRQDPCDWGLGFELRDHKAPHWTGWTNSPETFGHFGQSGSFLWVDPVAGLACAGLADRPFDSWAAHAWPRLADAVLAEHVGRGRHLAGGGPPRAAPAPVRPVPG